jgi:hypothetical protein
MAPCIIERKFYYGSMEDPDLDRAIATQIFAVAARHAHGQQLTAREEAVAIADLRQAAAGRADLLGEHAGVALGFGESRPDAARYRQVAELCLAAGADQALMECWIKIARQRAAVWVASSSKSPSGETDPTITLIPDSADAAFGPIG